MALILTLCDFVLSKLEQFFLNQPCFKASDIVILIVSSKIIPPSNLQPEDQWQNIEIPPFVNSGNVTFYLFFSPHAQQNHGVCFRRKEKRKIKSGKRRDLLGGGLNLVRVTLPNHRESFNQFKAPLVNPVKLCHCELRRVKENPDF